MNKNANKNKLKGKFPQGLFSNQKSDDKELYETIKKELSEKTKTVEDIFEKEKIREELGQELRKALEEDDIDKVKYCLKEGAKNFFENVIKFSSYNKLEKVEKLIELGADFNYINENGDGLLSAILKKEFKYENEKEIKTRIVKRMIDKGTDLNKINDGDNWTPIMYAARNDYKEIVDMLIKEGADIHYNNNSVTGPNYLLKVETHNQEIVDAIEKEWLNKLLKGNITDKYIIDRGLICAVKHGNIEDIEKILGMGADINCLFTNNKKYNVENDILVPLLVAMENEKEDVIKLLIEKGAKLSLEKERSGNDLMDNPHILVYCEKMLELAVNEYIKKIKEEDINKLIGEENTLLIYAAKLNFKDAVKKLIEMGADLEIKVNRRSHTTILDTALTMSIRKKNNEIAKMLIDAGAKIKEYSQSDSNPLYVAIKNKNVEIIEYLIKNKVDLNPKGHCNNPLIDAISDELENPIVELLIKNGADVNALGLFDKTALSKAIYNVDYKTIDLLIENGAKFIYEDDMGEEIDVMDSVNNEDLREYLEKIKVKKGL